MKLMMIPGRVVVSSMAFSTLPDYKPYLVHRLKESHDFNSVVSIHSKILKYGHFCISTFNHLINAYLRCRMVCDAEKLFDEMPDTNVVSWTSLMAGFVDAGRADRSVTLFEQMMGYQIQPNSFSFATAINACSQLADLRRGREIHALLVAFGLHRDLVVATSLIDMYGKCTNVADARRVFDSMVNRNIVSWGSVISVYTQNAFGHEALAVFVEFLEESPPVSRRPNHFMLSSVINACASMGRLGLGRSAHAMVIRHGHEENDVIAGALIDMYSKCGSIDYSGKVFDRIECPSLVPYTSMIVAAAKYGQGSVSLTLFDDMLDKRVKPNSVTLLGVLHACNHSGFVDTGLRHLKSMLQDHGIAPSAKHYTCAVDMLGRAGRLDEAYELSKEFRAEGDDALMLWSTLLSASRSHCRLDLVAEANGRLAEFDRDVAGAYVVMSNTLSSAGQWGDAAKVWAEMRRRGIRKDPGCSWVEIKDATYLFYAGEVSACARRDEVLRTLQELEVKMEAKGYVGGRGGVVVDGMEGEETSTVVGVHSEMLALGFGLISVPKGMTIRVMKNLRMCKDCHEAFKLISGIVGREFVVRDLNRFHHFREGSCTCGDYW